MLNADVLWCKLLREGAWDDFTFRDIFCLCIDFSGLFVHVLVGPVIGWIHVMPNQISIIHFNN